MDGDRVRLTVDRELHPLDAIYGAAYVFIDRCYVHGDATAGADATTGVDPDQITAIGLTGLASGRNHLFSTHERFGAGASRLMGGDLAPHGRLERAVAEFKGRQG